MTDLPNSKISEAVRVAIEHPREFTEMLLGAWLEQQRATALEPSLPLPVADGREIEQGQERSKRDVIFRPGWLQKRVAKSVESLNRLPADLRASLEQPTAAHRRRRAEGQERSEEKEHG